MNNIYEILNGFEAVSLDEMDSVKLMERTDTKYVFPYACLEKFLPLMMNQYKLLEINGVRNQDYESIYYDTPDFLCFKLHHAGKQNRYKLRFRKYSNTGGLTYFEIKFKDNKGTTRKKRTKMTGIEEGINEKAGSFILKHTPYQPGIFVPKIWICYSRLTFVNRNNKERLTIDTNLRYKKAGENDEGFVGFPGMVIAETKREKSASVSEFVRIIRNGGVRDGSLSKYCFGVYNLFNNVKKNNFKPRVFYIIKMAGLNKNLI